MQHDSVFSIENLNVFEFFIDRKWIFLLSLKFLKEMLWKFCFVKSFTKGLKGFMRKVGAMFGFEKNWDEL